MAKKVLGLDLDGVVYNLHEAAFIYLKDFYHFTGTFEELWQEPEPGCMRNPFWSTKNDLFIDNFFSIPPMYYKFPPSRQTMASLNRLAEKWDILYITHRSKPLEFTTMNFLRDFNFPNYTEVVFTKDKPLAICERGVDVYVEDTAREALKLKNLCDVYLMARHWNKSVQDQFKLVYSIEDLEEKLNASC